MSTKATVSQEKCCELQRTHKSLKKKALRDTPFIPPKLLGGITNLERAFCRSSVSEMPHREKFLCLFKILAYRNVSRSHPCHIRVDQNSGRECREWASSLAYVTFVTLFDVNQIALTIVAATVVTRPGEGRHELNVMSQIPVGPDSCG